MRRNKREKLEKNRNRMKREDGNDWWVEVLLQQSVREKREDANKMCTAVKRG